MTPALNIRPSNLDRVMACPGSAHAEAVFPQEASSPAAERGKKLHSGMALVFRVGYEVAIRKLAMTEGWTPADLSDITQAYDLAKPHFTPNNKTAELLVETQLDLTLLGITEGERRLDIALLDFQTRQITLGDYKFGASEVVDPERNRQLHAYAIGLLIKYKGQFDAVNLVIIQPAAWKQDDKVREATMSVDVLRGIGTEITEAVALAKLPDQLLQADPKTCQWCRAKETCKAFKVMKDVQAASKVQAREAEVVHGGEAIMVEGSEGDDFSLPLVVISADLVTRAQDYLDEAKVFEVTDADSANEAGRRAKAARALLKLIDDQRKAVKDRWLRITQQIDAAPKPATTKLTEGENLYMKQVQAFLAEEQKRANTLNAMVRLQEVEVQKALAAAEEAQRKAERARKPETQAAAQVKAEEAQATVQQAQAKLATTMNTMTAPAVTQVAGFKSEQVTYASIPDLSKIPAAYVPLVLMVDQKKLDALVASKVLNEVTGKGWLTLEVKTEAKRTR